MPDTEPELETPAPGKLGLWSSVTLGAIVVVLALIAADVALVGGMQSSASVRIRPAASIVKVSGADVQPVVYLSVTPGIKPGADGKLHDAFSVTDFYTHVGQPVTLVINNTDDVAHSITARSVGVNIVAKPGTHSYTLLVRKAGRFQWMCMMPCDPYSMSHDGYMRGYIVAS